MSNFSYKCAACGKPARQHLTVTPVVGEKGENLGSARLLGTWSCGCTPRGQKTKVKRERV